jgi:predicted Fe-Mo cluster-binding NifX family protein
MIKFYNRLRICKLLSFINCYNSEYKILKRIEDNNIQKLRKLRENDYNTVRLSIIEKLSRDGAIEIVIDQHLSKKTYKKLSNLPLSDYKLAMTRIEELINIAQNVNNQSNKISDNIPGL